MQDEQLSELDCIWADDLFDRHTEASQLQAYIESLVGRPSLRKDKQAFTIAVDAGYGEGKTFFLRRLAKQLALNHPVAFVDAWADDLADEPLTALAATLKQALEPFVSSPAVSSKLKSFLEKSGKVAVIATKGLVRRGAAVAIGGAALEGIDGVLEGAQDVVRDAIESGTKDVAEGLATDVAEAWENVDAHHLMERRVRDFEEGRAAIQAMKNSLSAIVSALDGTDRHPPIIIVIDELDRCRPSYAVKLLEEIKHLFDVPGLVFILGMHGQQLGYSVSGAYGSNFDGRAYLRRFIDRELTLQSPNLLKLVKYLCSAQNVNASQLRFPALADIDEGSRHLDFHEVIAAYISLYDLSARDTFQLIDILQTSLALAEGRHLYGAYLLPCAISHMKGASTGTMPVAVRQTNLRFIVKHGDFRASPLGITIQDVANDFQKATQLSFIALQELANRDNQNLGINAIFHTRDWNSRPLPIWDIARYPALISTVSRFTNPKSIEARKL